MVNRIARSKLAAALLAGTIIAGTVHIAGAGAQSQAPDGSPVCSARREVLRALEHDYGELIVSSGLTSAGALVEILASADGRTWSMLITWPGGATCLVLEGVQWGDERGSSRHAGRGR